MNIIYVIIGAMLATFGQFVDCWTTEQGVTCGKGQESNFFLAKIIQYLGITGMWIFKMVGLAQLLPILIGYLMGDFNLGIAAVGTIVGASGLLGGILNARQLVKAGVVKTFFQAWF